MVKLHNNNANKNTFTVTIKPWQSIYEGSTEESTI